MGQNIRINNKKLNGKVISISEDNNKSYLKILLENIDFEIPFGEVYTKDISVLFSDIDTSDKFKYEA